MVADDTSTGGVEEGETTANYTIQQLLE